MHKLDDDLTVLLAGPAFEVAARLLGCHLLRFIGDELVICRIVETEAYDQQDMASHSYKGETPRTSVMFGPAGRLYVYFTYGMHYCCNIVTGPSGVGSAVLLRAVEPVQGIKLMAQNRGSTEGSNISNGPAKLCQALQIDASYNGHNLHESPLRLVLKPPLEVTDIVQTTRVGISQAQNIPWRFYVRGNAYVSRP